VAWCDVHGPSAGLHRDEIGSEHNGVAIEKWMSRFDLVDLSAGK